MNNQSIEMVNNPIHVLSQETINQIAAGEVIERPSSVVKELLENSIDAGATALTLEIREGGISYIRITDNGCGIHKSQIAKAFLPHATSKIATSEDLNSIASLGFRGEALSTIAAVAQVELITRPKESLMGYSYTIEGGVEKGLEAIGAPVGTTIIVRNLFYQTPVRKKFLKSAQSEGGYISELVERIALSHPEISVRFIVNGQTKIATKGNASIKDLIYGIYGRDIASNLLEIHVENEFYQLTGFIGKPVIARGNRSLENYFVNGRYIKNKAITKGIEDGYKSFLMQHRYPFCVLHFQIDPELLDVNVHPTKMEMRVSKEQEIYRTLFYDINNTLSGKEYIPQSNFQKEAEQKVEQKAEQTATEHILERMQAVPEPFETNRRKQEGFVAEGNRYQSILTPPKTQTATIEVPKPEPLKPEPSKLEPLNPEPLKKEVSTTEAPKSQQNTLPIFHENPLEAHKVVSAEARKHYKLIGQVFQTYWIFEYDGNMYLMDQHAAHEKVLFEQKMKEFRERKMYSQYLVPQKIITLTNQQILAYQRIKDDLERFGYEIGEFGGNDYAIRAIPAGLPKMNEFDFFVELLDSVPDDIKSEGIAESLYDKIATMSCKAAVKGQNAMSLAEANALLDELMTLENPYMCPHGRPTMISFSRYDLDRKFKRIVDK